MFESIGRDVRAAMERDPAARSRVEVLLCYPGVHALWFHRLAHGLWRRGWVVTARLVSHLGRFLTGIEIHPGARIGPGLFIDHGMGVVIGETAEIGENVTLYQGVTLGGTSLRKEKRHPTLGMNVVVGAGAAILGAITIGDGSRIGGGSVVVNDVPPNSVVVGIPGKVIYRDGKRVEASIDLEHTDLPDPVAKTLDQFLGRIHTLESELESVKKVVERIRPERPDPGGGPPQEGDEPVLPRDRMTVQEASEYLALDAQTLTRMATERSVPGVEVEGQWVFSKKSLDKWRRQRESKR